MGRPPGAFSGNNRRSQHIHPHDWELCDPRLQELDTKEDDGRGVLLDAHAYAWRDAQRRQGGFGGENLYFDAHDLGQDRWNRTSLYDDGALDEYISEGDEGDDQWDPRPSQAYQPVTRDMEESLLHSALDRIARARVMGRTSINLSTEEMDALERRRYQQPEPGSTTALVSPPATPARSKGSKVKACSRSSSSASLKAQKNRKSTSSLSLFGSPAKLNSKAKGQRKTSTDQAQLYAPALAPPPGIIPGPNGMMYAPVGYYTPASPDLARVQPATHSRSSSKQSRRESTPPELQALPARFYAGRPECSSSNRSLPEDMEWHPPPSSRTRSASNAPPWAGYDYEGAPPVSAAPRRRNFSGPPAPGYASPAAAYAIDVRYASLRRAPPPSSPLASARGAPMMGSGLRRVDTSSNESSSGKNGVHVDILSHDDGVYSIREQEHVTTPGLATPTATATATSFPVKAGGERKKRRSGTR